MEEKQTAGQRSRRRVYSCDLSLQSATGRSKLLCHADLAARVASYTSLCDVIDLLQMCKHGHQIEPTLLEAKLADWIANHRVAYGVTL